MIKMPEPYMMYFTRPPRKDVFDAPIVMQSSGAPLQLPALMTPPALCLSRWRRISTTLCSLLPWRPAPQPVLKISPALMQLRCSLNTLPSTLHLHQFGSAKSLVSYISKNAVQWLVRIQMDKFKGNFTLT